MGRVRMMVAGVALASLAAGCSLGQDPKPSESASTRPAVESTAPEPSPTPTPDSTSEVEKATKLSQQYDYEGALALLDKASSPEAVAAAEKIRAAKAATVVWPDNVKVSHIFYHSLVIDPARAFGPKSKQRQGYLDYMVTEKEFRAQLVDLHQRGYVLILPRRLMKPDGAGGMKPIPLHLPAGKKPLILSIDDVSYYEYMDGEGFATKLLIDSSGKVTNSYTDAQGKTSEGAYDVSTVLDEFVAQHPDFSYRGDKGIFALTGYNGIFGYRSSEISYGKNAKTDAAKVEAAKVAKALKATGWEFASHSWGHIDLTKATVTAIAEDARKWDAEVRPLLGEVDQIIFAFGADISNVTPYSMSNPKFVELHKNRKFDYFFPIDGSAEYWGQVAAGTWRNARINVDGISMNRALKNKNDPLNKFFDVAKAFDPARKR